MPTFLHKHYNAVARMLGQMDEPDALVNILADRFCLFFLGDNPAFSAKSFKDAVRKARAKAPCENLTPCLSATEPEK